MTVPHRPTIAPAAFSAQPTAALCTAAWITRWFRAPITGYLVTDGLRLRFLTTDGPLFDLPLDQAGGGSAPWYTAGTALTLRVDGKPLYVSFAPPNTRDPHDPSVLAVYGGDAGERLALAAAAAPPPSLLTGRHTARRWQAIVDQGSVRHSDAATIQSLVAAEATHQTAEAIRPAWRDWVPAVCRACFALIVGLLLSVEGLGLQQSASHVLSALAWVFILGGPVVGIGGAIRILKNTGARRRLARATVGTAGIALLLGALAAPHASARAQGGAQAGALCRPAQRVEVVDFGKWYSAVVIGVRDDAHSPCRVHWIGYATTMDSWVPLSYLRAVGAGPTVPIPSLTTVPDPTLDSIRGGPAPVARAAVAGSVTAGHYACVAFVVNHLVNTGEFTITGPGTYRAGATTGRYAYDARTGHVRFQGGTWDGQSGDYTATPRPTVQIRGPSGRPVMGCERGDR